MLYELWQQVARERGSDIALCDCASGERWTFRQLLVLSEKHEPPSRPLAFPQGHHPGFLLSLLAAWRVGCPVCPLEPQQRVPTVAPPPAPCLHLKTTSATTGIARMAAFTEAQLKADAAQIVATMGLRPDWPNLGVISMAHSYGFSNLVLPLLLYGIPLILVPAPLPETLRKAALEWESLTLPAVPAMWRAWHEAQAIPKCVRLAISAGAPLPLALEQAVKSQHGIKIHNFYGSTECGGIAYDTTDQPRSDDACVGRPMSLADLTLNEEGCLRVHGPAVGETIWPQPDPALTPGKFQTSDLAELRDGWVHLRGRVGDLMNVAGRKLSPAAVEVVLVTHPAVQACVVFGAPARTGERVDLIVAAVVKSRAVTAEDLRHFLLNHLPAWQVPRDFWFVDSLTTHQLGKISRADWRNRYQSRT